MTNSPVADRLCSAFYDFLEGLREKCSIAKDEKLNVFCEVAVDNEENTLRNLIEATDSLFLKTGFSGSLLPMPQRDSLLSIAIEETFEWNSSEEGELFRAKIVMAHLSEFVKEEYRILEFWKRINAFETSVKLSEGRKPFSFYDGPPFATGLPHYGHILAGTIKDVVTRYAHMTGHYVERRFGWDCHGLPVEYEIDKKLGIKAREDVLAMGIENYNAECRGIVMRYSKEWEATVTRVGRWIDFANDYKTLNPSFMESVWWVFKQLFDKGQVYRGFRVMPYSTACSTPLSNFEANQNYKDVNDPSVVVSFPLENDPSVNLLAWTTTPWTLPSNLALCVNPDFEYVKIKDEESGKIYILLQKRLEILYKDVKKAKFTILEKIPGKALEGLHYTPLFNYFASRRESHRNFRVLADKYVTDESGTGIVHQAPAFGEDDFRVCQEAKIVEKDEVPCPVDENGRFVDPVTDFLGQHVKEADKDIQKVLKNMNRLVRQSQFNHSYPFCWRSDTPLIYRAIPSWFVRVEEIIPKLLKNNQKSYWVPDFVQEKRFHNWLENARDWNISRNRFWGTPIPLWVSEDLEEIVCVGSIAELKELSGRQDIDDLHRENVDKITIPSKMGKGTLRRIEEVFDCWFESGSMPYAQQHYPFENEEKFKRTFPADFIAEGLDQTRGWFYTLLILSTHLFDEPAFKNLIVNGLVLAADGKKMSKRLKNYPVPTMILDIFGADALRIYLINSPVVRAEPFRFKEEGVRSVVRDILLPWYNSFKFFFDRVKEFNSVEENGKFDPFGPKSTNYMDAWILASCQSLIAFVRQEMVAYRLYTVIPRLLNLIQELSNWYIRFNRRRFKVSTSNGVEDTHAALGTLFEVLLTLCKVNAPVTPFLSEKMYQELKVYLPATTENTESIHYLPFPESNETYFNEEIERAVKRLQKVIELGRTIRESKNIALKTPLSEVIVVCGDEEFRRDVKSLESYILDELNCRTLTVTGDEESYGVAYKALPNLKTLGQRLKGDIKAAKDCITSYSSSQWKEFMIKKSMKLVIPNTDRTYELTEDDIQVSRELQLKPEWELEGRTDAEVVVLLKVTVDEELRLEGLAREVINRVQKLRKRAKLVASDLVPMQYEILSDPNGELKKAITSQGPLFERSLRGNLCERVLEKADTLVMDEYEIEDIKFTLLLGNLKL